MASTGAPALPVTDALWRWSRTPHGRLRAATIPAAARELDAIIAGLGAVPLAAMAWPAPALKDEARVRLLLAAGMCLPVACAVAPSGGPGAPGQPLRQAACCVGASPAVHALLDGLSIPVPCRATALSWASSLACSGQLEGLRYLFGVHPEAMSGVASAPRSKLGLVLGGAWEKKSPTRPRLAGAILDFGVEMGVDWTLFTEALARFSSPRRAATAEAFGQALAEAHARLLARHMGPVPPPPARPRL